MTNPNLVKKTITDRNGIVSTRWVKPSDAPAKALIIQPPTISDPNFEDAQERMRNAMQQLRMDRSSMRDKTYENMWFLAQHAAQCLDRLTEQCSDFTLNLLWRDKLQNRPMFPITRDERDREQCIQTWERRLDLYPMSIEVIRNLGDHDGNEYILRDYTSGIDDKAYHLISLGTDTLSKNSTKEPDRDLAKAVALICIIRGTYDESQWRMFNEHLTYSDISDDADYIRDHVEEVQSLVPELTVRGTHDWETIRELLETESTALREGVL